MSPQESTSSYKVVGDALRTAALLQQFAEPGAVLISDTTERAVAGHVHTEPAGQVGRSAAFRVTGLRPHAQAMVQSGRVRGTFIGRGREVSLLDGLLTQVVAGKGQAVSVVGEPGMGKSRLVYEATRAMAARAESSIILEGRCVSYGSLVPYLPLIDLLRAHCGVLETDSPAAIREAIDEAVRNNGLPGRRGRVAPSPDQHRGRARCARVAQPRSGQGAHVRCAAPAVPESIGQAATGDRRRGRALDRSDFRGVSDDAGGPAGRSHGSS